MARSLVNVLYASSNGKHTMCWEAHRVHTTDTVLRVLNVYWKFILHSCTVCFALCVGYIPYNILMLYVTYFLMIRWECRVLVPRVSTVYIREWDKVVSASRASASKWVSCESVCHFIKWPNRRTSRNTKIIAFRAHVFSVCTKNLIPTIYTLNSDVFQFSLCTWSVSIVLWASTIIIIFPLVISVFFQRKTYGFFIFVSFLISFPLVFCFLCLFPFSRKKLNESWQLRIIDFSFRFLFLNFVWSVYFYNLSIWKYRGFTKHAKKEERTDDLYILNTVKFP